jgi:hypothetical protein
MLELEDSAKKIPESDRWLVSFTRRSFQFLVLTTTPFVSGGSRPILNGTVLRLRYPSFASKQKALYLTGPGA